MRAPSREERLFFEKLYSCTNSEERQLMLARRSLEQEFYPLLNTIKDEEKLQKIWARFDVETNKIDKRLAEIKKENNNV